MNNDKPVIVNFHAEWCEPCKILTPKLKELIEPLDNLDLAIVDVEENADLVHTFEVSILWNQVACFLATFIKKKYNLEVLILTFALC